MAALACLHCGGKDIGYPAFAMLRWRKGRWVPQAGSVEAADGADLLCLSCGGRMSCDDLSDPTKGLSKALDEFGFEERLMYFSGRENT